MDITARISELVNAPLAGAVDPGVLGVLFGCGDHVPTGRAVGDWREFSYGPEVHWYRLDATDILGYVYVASEGLPLWPSVADLESGV